jgi:hypothetical protein
VGKYEGKKPHEEVGVAGMIIIKLIERSKIGGLVIGHVASSGKHNHSTTAGHNERIVIPYTPTTHILLEQLLRHLRHPEHGNPVPKHVEVNLEYINKSN